MASLPEDKNKISHSQMESRWMRIFLFSLVFSVNFVTPLKCYLTGVPWPKECSFLIHERHGTNPACLSAVVLDGKAKII